MVGLRWFGGICLGSFWGWSYAAVAGPKMWFERTVVGWLSIVAPPTEYTLGVTTLTSATAMQRQLTEPPTDSTIHLQNESETRRRQEIQAETQAEAAALAARPPHHLADLPRPHLGHRFVQPGGPIQQISSSLPPIVKPQIAVNPRKDANMVTTQSSSSRRCSSRAAASSNSAPSARSAAA